MIGGFSKYILITILCGVIVIAAIILLAFKMRKSNQAADDLDDNKTLDLGESSQAEEDGMLTSADKAFAVEYNLTFIHTDEIIK